MYSRTPSSPPLALSLFKIASELGDEYATFTLVDEALKHGRVQDLQQSKLQQPLKHLKELADANNTIAMVLLARVLELKGEFRSALTTFKAAVAAVNNPNDKRDTRDKDALCEAWKEIARIEKTNGNLSKEMQAWEAAAMQGDDPKAFYELALRKADKSPSESLEHLLKAASSGVGDAAFKLGMAHCSSLEAGQDEKTSDARTSRTGANPGQALSKQYEMIKQWFTIASESENCAWRVHAKLQTARIMRKTGDSVQSLASLKDALHDLKLEASTNHSLLTSWTDPTFDPTCTDLERLLAAK